MKKILTLFLLCFILSSCESKSIGIIGGADGPTAIYVGEEDPWGLTLRAENVTKTGMTIEYHQSGGSVEGDLQTGADYIIEKYSDGVWQEADCKIENPVWNSMAYLIKKDAVTKFDINWEFLYGELSPGAYRLAKEIMDFKGPGGYEEKIYYAYFTVE